jgi:hypothetical protein
MDAMTTSPLGSLIGCRPSSPRYRHRVTGEDAPDAETQHEPSSKRGSASDEAFAWAAGHYTAILAIVGVLWFGLTSLAASIAYGPAGVAPREVGLNSSAVLAQSVISLLALLLLSTLFTAMYLAVFARLAPRSWKRAQKRRRRFVVSYFACAAGLVLFAAFVSASRLQDGRRYDLGRVPIPSPWQTQVADLAWSGGKPSDSIELPACAIYLGQADGTTVLYDPARETTIRIPSSLVVVTTRHDKDRC